MVGGRELVLRGRTLGASGDRHAGSHLLDTYVLSGHNSQCHGTKPDDERQLVLGLDFGTSSVKVVIGDSALGKAFAVPFTKSAGIERYLLPSCLNEADNIFSLQGDGSSYRDLKLSLLAGPTDRKCQDNVIAFLALVIRHARGWLLSELAPIYSNTRIVWKLVVGLPVIQPFETRLSKLFGRLGQIAWLVAGTEGHIDRARIHSARANSRALSMAAEQAPNPGDIEVEAVSELAAQIYGFVKSNQFDENARNIFLMVDIGAGTVDSSLFHVKPALGGRWDFEFFTSVVEPHGVMNLHRYRVAWWRDALLASSDPSARDLSYSLNGLVFPTDRMVALPDSYSQYFEGVTVDFPDARHNPDEKFYCRKVVRQVRGNTYWRTGNDGIVPRQSLKGISAFYCGGGTRMKLYDRLREDLRTFPGCTWLSALPRQIEIPSNLEAPTLRREDYDRLSVAYGLSFLEVGRIVRSLPKPKLVIPRESPW